MNRLLYTTCLLVITACTAEDPGTRPVPMSVTRTLGEQDTAGFKRVFQARDLVFPADHGSHPDFKNEWWYLTGNLEADNEQAFGFQFTVFRSALAPPGPRDEDRISTWATRQAFLAHTALSDITNGLFHHDERFSRGAMGLAGATSSPFRVWLDDWNMQEVPGPTGSCPDCLSASLRVSTQEYELSLRLTSSRSPALHGDRGLSAKSGTPGNASYYYSYTQLAAEGELVLGGTVHHVSGQAWFDHEWSTSALEKDQQGWDWFSLQLGDDSQLMLFQLRSKIEGDPGYLSGTHINGNGQTRVLGSDDFSIAASSHWTSDAGTTYPAGWEVSVPGEDLYLSVQSALADQEINASFRYWEGAVTVEGKRGDKAVSGRGYAELTGYDR